MPVRITPRLKAFAAVCATVLLTACATGPTVYSNTDPEADFFQYKTFGFFENLQTDARGYEALETGIIKEAITGEMTRRGLEQSEEPDLLVNFYIYTKEKLQSRQTPSTGVAYGHRGRYSTWATYGTQTEIQQYTEGTLTIDVVDAKTNKLAWEGAVVGRITQKKLENIEETLNAAVAATYQKFPLADLNLNTVIAAPDEQT